MIVDIDTYFTKKPRIKQVLWCQYPVPDIGWIADPSVPFNGSLVPRLMTKFPVTIVARQPNEPTAVKVFSILSKTGQLTKYRMCARII